MSDPTRVCDPECSRYGHTDTCLNVAEEQDLIYYRRGFAAGQAASAKDVSGSPSQAVTPGPMAGWEIADELRELAARLPATLIEVWKPLCDLADKLDPPLKRRARRSKSVSPSSGRAPSGGGE